MKYKEIILVILILSSAFLLRLHKISEPLLDWHSWRQTDTSAVSRSFVQKGYDILHPQFHDISNVASGKDNPLGYRFVEFPIYNVFQALSYQYIGQFSLEMWGRLISIVASLGTIVFLYLLTKKYLGFRAGFLTTLFYAILPYNLYYNRTVLPDTIMVAAIMGGIYFFDQAIEKKFHFAFFNFQFLFALVFTTSAFLIKPYALFFTLPMVYLAFRKWGFGSILKPQLWLFAIVSVVPLVLWRFWMQQFPEGIPASDWLFNGGNIRFKGSFFYWLFADRIGRLILGYWGIAILVIGLIRKISKEEGLFFYTFLVSSLLYLTIIARGNVQHDYYQILIIPTIAMFLGRGADFLLSAPKEYFSRVACYVLLGICSFGMVGFSWYFIRDYFNINNRAIVVAGDAVDKFTPKDAKIIAPMTGDTSFLYYTKRQGWASFQKPLPEMIQAGAQYLILINPTQNDFDGFGKEFKTVSSTSDYLLLNLREKP